MWMVAPHINTTALLCAWRAVQLKYCFSLARAHGFAGDRSLASGLSRGRARFLGWAVSLVRGRSLSLARGLSLSRARGLARARSVSLSRAVSLSLSRVWSLSLSRARSLSLVRGRSLSLSRAHRPAARAGPSKRHRLLRPPH